MGLPKPSAGWPPIVPRRCEPRSAARSPMRNTSRSNATTSWSGQSTGRWPELQAYATETSAMPGSGPLNSASAARHSSSGATAEVRRCDDDMPTLTNCSICSKPCSRSMPQRGWKPPAKHRCQECRRSAGPRCSCGASMDRESRQCKNCHRANQGATTAGRRAGQKAWHVRSSAAPGIPRRARRQLLIRWRKQGRTCIYCSAPCEVIDHVLPLILGGTNYEGNLAPACCRCNLSKSDDLLIVWRRKRGDLKVVAA